MAAVQAGQGPAAPGSGRSVFSCGGVAGPLVLAGEEAVQFCGYPVGLLAVVRGGVPGAVQHHSPGVRQDPAEAVERGGEVACTPGPAKQQGLARQRREPLKRPGRAVDRPGVVPIPALPFPVQLDVLSADAGTSVYEIGLA